MSRDTKKVLRITSITEYKTLEKYLEKKAAMGLMLCDIRKNVLTFKKVNPRNLTFNVSLFYPSTPFDYPDFEEEKYYRELCEDSGWKYCASNETYQIFFKEENADAVPVHTDSREEYRIIKNIFMKTEFIAMLCLILITVISINQALGFDYSYLFSDSSLFVIISPVFILIIGLLLYVPPIIWFIRNKINVSRGQELSFISYRGRLALTVVQWSMIAVYLLVVIFGVTEGYKNIKGIVAFTPTFISIIVGRFCYGRIKTKKNTRKHNIIFVLTVCIVTAVVVTSSSIMYIMFSMGRINDNEIPEKIAVLKLSDLGISDEPQRSHSHKKSSILVPAYLEYYETLGRKAKDNEVRSITTIYIECRDKIIADYIFHGYMEEKKEKLEMRISESIEYGDIEKAKEEENSISKVYDDIWEADRGYYLAHDKSEIIIQKNNIIYILKSDVDFSQDKIINICKQKLNH